MAQAVAPAHAHLASEAKMKVSWAESRRLAPWPSRWWVCSSRPSSTYVQMHSSDCTYVWTSMGLLIVRMAMLYVCAVFMPGHARALWTEHYICHDIISVLYICIRIYSYMCLYHSYVTLYSPRRSTKADMPTTEATVEIITSVKVRTRGKFCMHSYHLPSVIALRMATATITINGSTI